MGEEAPAVFEAGAAFLLRAPGLPRDTLSRELTEAGQRDPVVAESLLVSSPSLHAALEGVRAGRVLTSKQLGRLSRSVLSYHLRMTRRPTPFGLLAGVAVGSFGSAPRAVLSGRRTRQIQPDQAWLAQVLRARDLAAPPDDLRVVLDSTVRIRGDQLVLPLGLGSGRPVRRSILRTSPVVAVSRTARRPLRLGDLTTEVVKECPGLTRARVSELLTRLIALEFLLTDSAPNPADPDPFEHIARTAAESPIISEYVSRAHDYAATAVGQGTNALSTLYDAAGSSQCLHVDMALDADVRLPPAVAGEAATAATVLWRCAPPQTAEQRALSAYHREFLETYGQGERVPLSDLLAVGTGLGAPAGYTLPGGSRLLPAPPQDGTRSAALNALYARALMSGSTSVDLDEETVRALETGGRTQPASVDLTVSLHAESLDDIAENRFVLEVVPFRVCRPAGTLWGRFAHLLGLQEHLTEFSLHARRGEGARSKPVRVDYAPRGRRMLNVMRVPDPPGLAVSRLAVGTYADPDVPRRVDLADIQVYADTQGFHLLDAADGCPISPYVPHALNNEFASDIARFLLEVPLMGITQVVPWDWGHLANAPFVPGVRYGRSILSPAIWRIPAARLEAGDPALRLAQESARWRIPDQVQLVRADQRLPLDLRIPEHRLLLCEEARRQGEVVLHEDLSAAASGWLRGPGGIHDAEIVVPLFALPPCDEEAGGSGSGKIGSVNASEPGVTATARVATMPTREVAAHLPGGDWLSVHIPSAPEDQSRILTAYVEPWLQTVGDYVDRWFFLRYREPVTYVPHLRLRLHGARAALVRQVLPSLHDWMCDLMADGLARTWSLQEYRPEADRYGGSAIVGLAEQFFHADSRLTLARLSKDSDPLPVAADLVRLVRGFHADHGQDWERWLLDHYAKDQRRHKAFSDRRRDSLTAIPDGGGNPSDEFSDWHAALSAYSHAVHAGDADVSRILRALLHMHANRRLRLGMDLEDDAYAIARGAVSTHYDRRRASQRADDDRDENRSRCP